MVQYEEVQDQIVGRRSATLIVHLIINLIK